MARPGGFADRADAEVFATTAGFIIEPDVGDSKEWDIVAQDCGPGVGPRLVRAVRLADLNAS